MKTVGETENEKCAEVSMDASKRKEFYVKVATVGKQNPV